MHTKETWFFEKSDNCVAVEKDGEPLEICHVGNIDFNGKYFFGEESKANANLIVAAPALLKALEGLSGAYSMPCHQVCENPESNKYYAAALCAIAEARGEE